MNDEEQLRRLLMQLETGRRQLEQLGKQAQMIEAAVAELNSAREALTALKDQKVGDELLVQVGSGAFIRVALKDTEKVLVGIGAGMSAEKKVPDAIQTFETRTKQLAESMASTQKMIGELSMKVAELNSQAETLAAQER
jgi:prefoldin alpha subunit